VRVIYLIAGLIVSVLVLSNIPRIPWVDEGPAGIFRGFAHGMVGFSYLATWILLIGGAYQLVLGILYYDMDTTERTRFTFTLESGGTARLLWVSGAVTMLLGVAYAAYIFRHDNYVWPAGAASSTVAILACWLYWLAFPLYEQVGIDRAEL